MYNLVGHKRWYFTASAIVIGLGLLAMAYSTANYGSPVLLSVDFTGGSLFELKFLTAQEHLEAILAPYEVDASPLVEDVGEGSWQVTIDEDTSDDVRRGVLLALQDLDPDADQGGDQYSLSLPAYGQSSEERIRAVFTSFGLDDPRIQRLGEPEQQRWQIRTSFVGEDQQAEITAALEEQIAPIDGGTLRIERVTPTVGGEVTRAAVLAVLAVAVIILGFIIFAFRQVPKAFRYGTCAIVTMFHDVLVTMGVMSMMGILFGWEADALFLTAVLTVVGYSVQDTIVIFDRIRENIPRRRNEPYETVINRSILETIHRSLATQLNAVFVMVALLLFGGETIKQFIAILLIGLVSGTYSSIFTAVPLLVAWEKGEIPLLRRFSRS
jgi:preprotein translocase subunit SecF